MAGGKEKRLTELLKILHSEPDIYFELILMNKKIHYQEVLNSNIKIHYLIRKTKKDFSIFKKFYKICKEFSPEIVHCWDSMTAIYAIPSCKLLKIRLVNGMVVDTPVNQNIFNKKWLFAKLTFPFSNIIIGNSYAGLLAYSAPPDKSKCIYNGMDFLRFSQLPDRLITLKKIFGDKLNEVFVIGMVAAFEKRKDYETLIKAALPITDKYNFTRFLLIGDGELLTKIKNMVPLSKNERIIFLGKTDKVEPVINTFDIGILLTNSQVHGEGISNSIIEYMALAKPVIATKGGGTNEIIHSGENGYLIDPNNESQLIQKIEDLIKDKNRIILGKRGKQIALEKFDIRIMATQYVQTYQSLLRKKEK